MMILLPLRHPVEKSLPQSVKFASDMEVSWPLCQPFTSLAASLAVVEVVVELYIMKYYYHFLLLQLLLLLYLPLLITSLATSISRSSSRQIKTAPCCYSASNFVSLENHKASEG